MSGPGEGGPADAPSDPPSDPPSGAEARAAYDGFALALRIMYLLYAPDAPGTEAERPWEMLKEVAEGRLSLSNPADLAARFPEMKDFLFDTANQVVARERETALAILRGMQDAL